MFRCDFDASLDCAASLLVNCVNPECVFINDYVRLSTVVKESVSTYVCCLMAVIGVKSEVAGKRRSSRECRARRCLFGRPSQPELVDVMSDWRQHQQRIVTDKQQQWNFDFERMTPLPGRWQWELVSQQPAPPSSAVDQRADEDPDKATSSVVECSRSTAVETSSWETLTSNGQPQRKRARQTTLPGSLLCHILCILARLHGRSAGHLTSWS